MEAYSQTLALVNEVEMNDIYHICSLKITNSPTALITKHLTRAIRAINITEFCHDILLV